MFEEAKVQRKNVEIVYGLNLPNIISAVEINELNPLLKNSGEWGVRVVFLTFL
jgi:hypothetical protein